MVEKVIDKIKKLKAVEMSERELGNEEAAEAFAAKINQLLLDHELNASDIDYSATQKEDPITEVLVRWQNYGVVQKKQRSAWQEELAGFVAEAHLCKILVAPGSNNIWFVGTRAHAEVAEYAFGTLVPLISLMSRQARRKVRRGLKKENDGDASGAYGFREAWINGFVNRIGQRYRLIRQESIQNSDIRRGESGPSTSTALVRLNNAALRVKEHMEAKYKKKASSVGGSFTMQAGSNGGYAAGRAAADAVPLGRTGLGKGEGTRGQLR